MPVRILVVEDDAAVADVLVSWVKSQRWAAVQAATGADAVAMAADHAPDLVLLDLMLPDFSGIEVCRRLRAARTTLHTPVVVVSGRTDAYDRVVSFEAGADDYVTKPFSLRELELRVRALLRRALPSLGEATLRDGGLVVDTDAHLVTLEGVPLSLTPVEFRLLRTFLEQRGRALSRSELRIRTWGEATVSERAVDTHIKRLRRKLGPMEPRLQTVRGIGYRWADGGRSNSETLRKR